jgi:hypothetical protein
MFSTIINNISVIIPQLILLPYWYGMTITISTLSHLQQLSHKVISFAPRHGRETYLTTYIYIYMYVLY